MKKERVLAWGMEAGSPASSFLPVKSFPFAVDSVAGFSIGQMTGLLARESYDVLCVEDAFPFERTRELLQRTDALPERPVIICVTRDIDVATTVELMERGVFSVVSRPSDPKSVGGAVHRALDNRRAFRRIINMSRSLQRSRSFLLRKSVALSEERSKLRRKVSEVTLMRRAAEWLGRAKSLEDGLLEVLRNLSSFLGSEHGVFLVNPERDRWVVCDDGDPAMDPASLARTPDRFRRASGCRVAPDGTIGTVSGAAAGEHVDAIAFPVRVKRRFLGYGIFRGGRIPRPSPDTLRLLDAVGVQVGAFCENICLREQVATERDRLSRAKDELNFLFNLASSLHEDPDMDAVFRWLCREMGDFIPCTGLSLLSLAGKPVLRTAGISVSRDRDGGVASRYARRWRKYLGAEKEGRNAVGPIEVREFPDVLGKRTAKPGAAARGGQEWSSPLSFGNRVLGFMTVHLPDASPADMARERVLKSITAQMSIYLHNFEEREKVRVMASNDGLTGLYNYRSFQDRFEREFEWYLRRDRNLSLLMIDLDNFKQINDTFGHQVGDQVLREVAAILQANLRKTDYAFRYGGDEFVILMPEVSLGQAEVFAQRVRAEVRRQVRGVPPYEFRLSLSIGIADCTVLVSREREELLKRADGALYQAKARGRDRIQTAERPPAAKTGNGVLHAF